MAIQYRYKVTEISERAKASQRGGQTDPRGDPAIPELGDQPNPLQKGAQRGNDKGTVSLQR